jgi:hypothetical protein
VTVLSAIQEACASGIALDRPASVYGSSIREHIELASIANETAQMIAASHEWQGLQKIASITGDGTTTVFSLPSDFFRMLTETQLWSSVIDGPLMPIRDRDHWLNVITKDYEFMANAWIIFGDEINFRPALDASEVVSYFYQTSHIVRAQDNSTKAEFNNDMDTFRLDERLLKLGIIWRWRDMKGLPYAENLADYERWKEKLIHSDRGPAILRDSRSRLRGMGSAAYPWQIPQ